MSIDSYTLKAAIRDALIQGLPLEVSSQVFATVDSIMELLAKAQLVSYITKDFPSLSTPAGRLLTLVMSNPDLTLRDYAVRMGITETNVQKQMTNLVSDGLIERQKVLRNYTYRANAEKVLAHPDVQNLLWGLSNLAKNLDDIQANHPETEPPSTRQRSRRQPE